MTHNINTAILHIDFFAIVDSPLISISYRKDKTPML